MDTSAEASFKAALAQQLTESSAVSSAEPMEVDHPAVMEHIQREDLERIAEHVRQETHEAPTLQDQHEVLKHIGADSSSTLATVPITPER